MTRRLIPPLATRLADPEVERARAHIERRVDELQALPAVEFTLIATNLELPDSTLVPIRHTLGRAPRFVFVSPVRGATASGVIEEFDTTFATGEPVDRTKFIVLAATNFGATVRVDVAVL